MTSATRLPKATRVMRARQQGTCPLCRRPIIVGQQIAKARIWAHIDCVIDHATATYASTP
jgi:ribosomal protein L37AE/L43A